MHALIRPAPFIHLIFKALLPLSAVLLTACAGMASQPGFCCLDGLGGPPVLSEDRIAKIVASPDRSAADKANDARRKPQEMLAFIGVRPGMVALDLSTGGGYTTELLARAVGPAGRAYGQSQPPRDPNAPPAPARPAVAPEGNAMPPAAAGANASPAVRRTSAQALMARTRNPGAGNIISVVRPFDSPVPEALANEALDVVTLMFNYHDLGHMGIDREAMNKAVFAALKPGGIYVIADHAGRPGTGISEAGTLHRMEEAFLVEEIEAIGFTLEAVGDFLRNPNDPRDKNTPDPAMPKDEFVVKFVKP